MCRINGLRSMAEMFQNPLDDCGFLDAGDHPQLPAALAAGLNVDGEYPLEALCPGHRLLSASGRCLTALGGSDGVCPGHNLCPFRARRRENAMVTGQVRAGFWRQRGESRNWASAIQDVTEKDDSTIVATINPRIKDGYRWQLVARIVPNASKLLFPKAQKYIAHAHKED